MKGNFNRLPMRTWLLLMVPVVFIAYPLVNIVLPVVLRAVVPKVVQTMLHLM